MAVSIRLARQGAKKRPFYRIVATDRRSPRDGRFIEQLGYYDPRAKVVKIDLARYDHWVSVGGQPSETVRNIVRKEKGEAPVIPAKAAPAKPAPAKADTAEA
jgi:small subunit ribosomal protein S16